MDKQTESGVIVGICIFLAALIVVGAILSGGVAR